MQYLESIGRDLLGTIIRLNPAEDCIGTIASHNDRLYLSWYIRCHDVGSIGVVTPSLSIVGSIAEAIGVTRCDLGAIDCDLGLHADLQGSPVANFWSLVPLDLVAGDVGAAV